MEVKQIVQGKRIRYFALVLLLACQAMGLLNLSHAQEKAPIPEFPVDLFFSIENGGIDSLDLNVTIDGITVTNQRFSNRGDTRVDTTRPSKTLARAVSPHRHWEFTLTLPDGTHQIMASTSNGDAALDVVFELHKPLWLVLSYWGKNHLQLNISERRVSFI
jgi:hypothetical protein